MFKKKHRIVTVIRDAKTTNIIFILSTDEWFFPRVFSLHVYSNSEYYYPIHYSALKLHKIIFSLSILDRFIGFFAIYGPLNFVRLISQFSKRSINTFIRGVLQPRRLDKRGTPVGRERFRDVFIVFIFIEWKTIWEQEKEHTHTHTEMIFNVSSPPSQKKMKNSVYGPIPLYKNNTVNYTVFNASKNIFTDR